MPLTHNGLRALIHTIRLSNTLGPLPPSLTSRSKFHS